MDFENELGKIKRVLFSPHSTIAQYCRRVHTQRKTLNAVPNLPLTLRIIKKCKTKIFKINYKQYYFSTQHPDNTALLTDGSIIQIHKIFFASKKVCLLVSSFNIKKPIHKKPCDSKLLQSYEIEETLSAQRKFIGLDSTECKLIKFRLNYPDNGKLNIFILPLLH